MDLEVTQRIHIGFSGDEAVGTAVAYYLDYIESETLAISCKEGRLDGVNGAEWTLNGHPCTLFISPANTEVKYSPNVSAYVLYHQGSTKCS